MDLTISKNLSLMESTISGSLDGLELDNSCDVIEKSIVIDILKDLKKLVDASNKQLKPGRTKEEEMEEFFLECLNGCTIKITKEYPDIIFYMKDDSLMMQYDSKEKNFWLRYSKMWSVFETRFNISSSKLIQGFTELMVEKHLKYEGITTGRCIGEM